MINIAVSARALSAARAVDPDVSPAAVQAAVAAALAEHSRQHRRERSDGRPERRTAERRRGRASEGLSVWGLSVGEAERPSARPGRPGGAADDEPGV
jgi:post-segregation antitoxin (ccd killing protein)